MIRGIRTLTPKLLPYSEKDSSFDNESALQLSYASRCNLIPVLNLDPTGTLIHNRSVTLFTNLGLILRLVWILFLGLIIYISYLHLKSRSKLSFEIQS